jgi:hypothetical protein
LIDNGISVPLSFSWQFSGRVNNAGSAEILLAWRRVLQFLVRKHLFRLSVSLLPAAATPVSAPEALQTTHRHGFCGVGSVPSSKYSAQEAFRFWYLPLTNTALPLSVRVLPKSVDITLKGSCAFIHYAITGYELFVRSSITGKGIYFHIQNDSVRLRLTVE